MHFFAFFSYTDMIFGHAHTHGQNANSDEMDKVYIWEDANVEQNIIGVWWISRVENRETTPHRSKSENSKKKKEKLSPILQSLPPRNTTRSTSVPASMSVV